MTLGALLIVLAVLALVAFVVFRFTARGGTARYTAESERAMMQLTGLGRPVENRLDPRFTDADGDGVADAPGDAATRPMPAELVFSYVALRDPSGVEAAFGDLASALSQATGRPVRVLAVSDADEQVRSLADGRLHVTAFNTGQVPLAVNAAGFVPVSTIARDDGGTPGGTSVGTYRMKVVVPSAGPIRDLAGLRGREITLTDPTSNSGFKAPLVLLNSEGGLYPGRDYAIRYSGGHEQSIAGLASGAFEAAAVASDVLDREVARGTIATDSFRVIFESEPFPPAAFGYAHDLPPDVASTVRGVLETFAFAGTSLDSFFAGTGQTRLAPIDYRRDFALVRTVDDRIGYAHRLPPESQADDSAGQNAPAEPAF